MTSYCVTFFKDLVNSNGHRFKCPQGRIKVRSARSCQRALRAAEIRFERLKRINSWTLYADTAEVEATEANGKLWCCSEPARARGVLPPAYPSEEDAGDSRSI